MTVATGFFEKSRQLFQFYREGKYADALEIAKRLADEYTERGASTFFWRMCLLAVSGQEAKALDVFSQALSQGVWWAEFRLRADSDLASLQGNEEFERLVKRSKEMHMQAEADAKPGLVVRQPDGNGPFPLLIALGPRGSVPEFDLRDWLPAFNLGWMLALPQSSQLGSPQSFVWDDREKTFDEIEVHYKTLLKDYPVDPSRIVIAGFSQGAARAIELVMSQRLNAMGFVAIVPGRLDFPELEGWAGSGLGRGVLISGGKDPNYEKFIQIKAMFERHNIPLMFENFPEMAHQIPVEFEQVLKRSLNFLCNKEKETE